MPQLIVTAHRLNKRKVIPTVLPDPNNKAGEVFLNHTFEAEEVAEVPNPSLGKWYKDRDGYFYWSGGLNEAPDVVTGVDTAPVYDINYKKTLDFLPAEWLGKDSPDSHIIIIDTASSKIRNFEVELGARQRSSRLRHSLFFWTQAKGHRIE